MPMTQRPYLVDLTVRPPIPPEIEVEPDGTIEVTWERSVGGDAAALTFLLSPEVFRAILERGHELIVAGKVRGDARPRG